MQPSPWLAAPGALGKSLTCGGEDRAAAKWMLGALPGIKHMEPTAASGHRRGVLGTGKALNARRPVSHLDAKHVGFYHRNIMFVAEYQADSQTRAATFVFLFSLFFLKVRLTLN